MLITEKDVGREVLLRYGGRAIIEKFDLKCIDSELIVRCSDSNDTSNSWYTIEGFYVPIKGIATPWDIVGFIE